MGIEVYHALKSLLSKKFGKSATLVGDEGGFGAPQITDENLCLEIIMEAIQNSGHAGKIDISLDPAASEFYDAESNTYNLSQKSGKNDRVMSPDELIGVYTKMADNYPIVRIEDPFDQDDFYAWSKMTSEIGDRCQIVGDDLLVTNPKRVQLGID